METQEQQKRKSKLCGCGDCSMSSRDKNTDTLFSTLFKQIHCHVCFLTNVLISLKGVPRTLLLQLTPIRRAAYLPPKIAFPTSKLHTPSPKHNSLKFQLSCVSKESGTGLTSPKKPLMDEDYSEVLIFLHLPATVLSSLCSSNNLICDTSVGQQAFASKTLSYNIVKGDDKESYIVDI
eukprot:12597875-Ditylum_brightwellii.AAC.1